MIWGGISRDHKSNLVLVVGTLNAERHISDVLQAEGLPFLRETPDVFALQQDNAHAHVASSTLSYLRDQNILFCRGLLSVQTSTPLRMSGHG